MTDRELMQMALDALDLVTDLTSYDDEVYEAIDALRARLSQCERCGEVNPAEIHTCTPKQPAWHHVDCEGECIACLIEREVLVAYGNQGLNYLLSHLFAPPQREWQGLTDEEIQQTLWKELGIGQDDDEISEFARAIEAKLKEKNT